MPTFQNPRYKIMRDLVRLRLYPTSRVCGESEEIFFSTTSAYFVDILEVDSNYDRIVKMKIYMPDGRINIGWQNVSFLEIHFFDNQFDGRYNAK